MTSCISNSNSRNEGLIWCIHDPFFFFHNPLPFISNCTEEKSTDHPINCYWTEALHSEGWVLALRDDGEEDEVKVLFGIPVCLKFFNPYFHLMSKFMANQRLYAINILLRASFSYTVCENKWYYIQILPYKY